MLELVRSLIADFDAAQVRYCHWKSNNSIVAACNGKGDLDLLFDRSQYALVTGQLVSLGFKRLESGLDRQFPGVEDYLGHDLATGKLVHLQAHWCLVTGQPLLKNYHFPVERLVLSRTIKEAQTGMPVPEPSVEAVIHVLRAYIKIGFNKVMRPALFRSLIESAASELDLLLDREDCDPVAAFKVMFPAQDAETFAAACELLRSKPGGLQWIRARRSLATMLASAARRARMRTIVTYLVRRLYLAVSSRQAGKIPRRKLASGGIGLAIIGSDGAGKSTAVSMLSDWLGKRVALEQCHMGKPPKSLLTFFVAYAVGFCRRLNDSFDLPKPARSNVPAWPRGLRWLPALLLWSLARDRYRHFQQAQRLVGSGHIVVFDRFPMPGLQLMEGPLIDALGEPGALVSRMARMESDWYARMNPPSVVLALAVDPEIAAVRQSGDGREYVLRRAQAVLDYLTEQGATLTAVDANQALEVVAEELRSLVWGRL